jgi:hypothetical protein
LLVRSTFLFDILLIYTQVALREERDNLLAEKESWIKSSVNTNASPDATLDETKRLWETEKAELLKSRDHAASQAKVRCLGRHSCLSHQLIIAADTGCY